MLKFQICFEYDNRIVQVFMEEKFIRQKIARGTRKSRNGWVKTLTEYCHLVEEFHKIPRSYRGDF